jgi:hypothetical protein
MRSLVLADISIVNLFVGRFIMRLYASQHIVQRREHV